MADRSSFSSSSLSCSDLSAPATKKSKRQVTIATFERWKSQFDREYQSLLWLCCEKDLSNRTYVSTLFCKVCREYESKIESLRNYSAAWVNGSSNHKTSNIVDHAKSEQHSVAMSYLRRAQAKVSNQPLTTYSPIARSLSTLDVSQIAKMKSKFEICYVIAREGVAFLKYPAFHALAERQGVNLGSSYKRNDCAKVFVHFIAEAQRKDLLETLKETKFMSFLVDGSTDSSNNEQEIFFLVFWLRDDSTKQVKSLTRYFAISSPSSGDADGLLKCVRDVFQVRFRINVCEKESVLSGDYPVLIGVGTDGASVNIGVHNGLRAKMQDSLPWLHWTWCFSHRLELACKDSFTSTLFNDISDMLLRLYYLYSKSPKKTRELEAIGEELKEVFDFPKGRDLPVRCNGTRWINHKRRALQQIVDRFGIYLAHLTTLAQDPSVKPNDQCKLAGYVRKWSCAKMLLGCSLYIDILKIPAILSLTLQEDEMDIIQGIKGLLKAASSLNSLSEKNPEEWLTVKLVLSRISEDTSETTYQGSKLTGYSVSTLSSCVSRAKADLEKLQLNIKERIAWSDAQLLRSILVFLDTCSWSTRSGSSEDDKSHVREAVECIVGVFREPLEAKEHKFLHYKTNLKKLWNSLGIVLTQEKSTGRCGINFLRLQMLESGRTFCYCVSYFSAYPSRIAKWKEVFQL